MSSNPYENEPGFESANDEADKKNQKDYVAKVSCRKVHFWATLITTCRYATKPSELL